MEEQDHLYQFYYHPEHNHKLNFIPVSGKANHLKYPRNGYTELTNRCVSIDTSRVLPISLACISRCSSKTYVDLSDDESTPLLNGNAKLPRKLSSNRRGIWLSIFIVFYTGFLILGSLTFRTFELKEELKERQSYRDVRQGFLVKYPSVLGRPYIFSSFLNLSFLDWCFQISLNVVFFVSFVADDDLEEFIENVVKINGKGVSVLRNATGDLNWSFGQALIFSATVITTIGKRIT